MKKKFSPDRISLVVYLLLLLLVIIDRGLTLFHFAFRYTDHDQALMWYSAKEFMHGRFHEPCFYGQAYNTMMEGLISVPFIRAGMAYPVALPLLTSILALFPFIIFSFIALKQEKYSQACLMLLMPLSLPVEYGMISSMPRGFVTGIFIAAFSCIAMFNPHGKISWALYGFFGALALWVNPNSGLIVIPVGLFLLLNNYREIKFFLLIPGGLLPILVWVYFSHHFYESHPKFNWFHPINFLFSLNQLGESFKNMDQLLNYVTPLYWREGWIVLIMIFIVSLLLFRQRNFKAAFSLLFALFLIILSFGMTKVHEGTDNVFYSYSRMFLGVPVLLALFIGQLKMNFSKRWAVSLGFIGLIFFIIKNHDLDQSIEKSLSVPNEKMNFYETSLIKTSCHDLNNLAREQHVSLIISLNTLYDQMFGCNCLEDSFPGTLVTFHERRTWRFTEEEHAIHENILLIGNQLTDSSLQIIAESSDIKKLTPSFSWFHNNIYLITNNHLAVPQLLSSLGIKTRYY